MRGRRRWTVRRVITYLVIAAVIGLAVWVVSGKTDELAGATGYLDHLRWEWVLVGAVFEVASLVAFAALQQRLLAAGRVSIGIGPLTAITFAGNALANSLPGGIAFSDVWAFRQFRLRGADEVLSAWTLIATTALSQLTLVLLAATGLGISNSTGSALNLVSVILGVFFLAGAILAAWVKRGAWLPRLAGPLRLVQRVAGRPRGDAHVLVARAIERMESVTPSHNDWAVGAAMAMANWVFDMVCLGTAFLAIGEGVPWRGIVLAYGAAQLAANLPITPGGLGVVEGSLTIALVAYGGAEASTVAAVLLYRLMSYWAMLPIGWVACGSVSWLSRRRPPVPLVGGAG